MVTLISGPAVCAFSEQQLDKLRPPIAGRIVQRGVVLGVPDLLVSLTAHQLCCNVKPRDTSNRAVKTGSQDT